MRVPVLHQHAATDVRWTTAAVVPLFGSIRGDRPRPRCRQGLPAAYSYVPCFEVRRFFPAHVDYTFSASGQAVVTGVVPSFPPVLAFNFYRA